MTTDISLSYILIYVTPRNFFATLNQNEYFPILVLSSQNSGLGALEVGTAAVPLGSTL